MMTSACWVLLATLVYLTSASNYKNNGVEKREVDPVFLRRYNHLKHVDPVAATFLKYFLKNRAQRRDKRETDAFNNYLEVDAGYDNPDKHLVVRQTDSRRRIQRTRDNKRDLLSKRKVPFRPKLSI